MTLYLGVNLSLLALWWIATLFLTLPGQVLPAAVPFGPFTLPLRVLGNVALSLQVVVVLVAVVGLALWLDARSLPRLAALLALVLFGAVTVHAAVLLNYSGYASAAELPVPARTSADLRALLREVSDSYDALGVGSRPRAVRVVAFDPVLGWYLRESPNVAYSARPVSGEGLVIAPFDAEPPPGRSAAQRFRLRTEWDVNPANVSAFWRWLTLREPPVKLRTEDLVLYLGMM